MLPLPPEAHPGPVHVDLLLLPGPGPLHTGQGEGLNEFSVFENIQIHQGCKISVFLSFVLTLAKLESETNFDIFENKTITDLICNMYI